MASDHAPAEQTPGTTAPAAQPALQPGGATSLLPSGLMTPQILNQPAAGTPSADINAPVYRPGTVALLRPPLTSPAGTPKLLLAGLNAANALPNLANQSGSQANLVPLIAFPVLARMGPNAVSWAAAIPLLTTVANVTVRGTYRDLKITPGWRGLQISYATGSMTIKENTTGMVYNLPTGPHTVFVPLFMLREVFDLTILASANFPAGASALLTTEEQVPYMF